MTSPDDPGNLAYDVTYRATVAGGRQVEIRLQTTFMAATLADAWERLTALHDGVDPRTIEIELREFAAPHSAQPTLTREKRRRHRDNFQNSRSAGSCGEWIDPRPMLYPV